MKPKKYILPIIVFAQFACTSLWFAGNAIVDQIPILKDNGSEYIGHLLSSVQLGFIIGTLTFALLMIADRFSPSKVFLTCSFLAAACNTIILLPNLSITGIILVRFGTGFFLAGIYPVGMKIAADYYEAGLGKALGYLVGALVLGTAFPHFLNGINWSTNYSFITKGTSALAVLGGLSLVIFVKDGPFRKPSQRLLLNATTNLFKIKQFKIAALGYFGHMWELYAFWAFVPVAFQYYNKLHESNESSPFVVFTIIAVGLLSCIIGGYIAIRKGSKKVAVISLLISGICCLCSPLLFQLPYPVFLSVFVIWGMVVISDSPQFSTLVAQAAAPELKGTGLTIVNCIGFAISIISIQLLAYLSEHIEIKFLFIPLAIGPLFGLFYLLKKSPNKL
ncbi:MFS transporter [Spongiivirga citrea]|uniref:MFS transporter n=1 Tax=Spongiivirga citrea TaxID=1481457 RepID=A0A6M0CLH4_9FLAO|nr:MFS transporter [Spongiivirga citrea]NER18512.1 MFS transporter [Spongiivirga citrea]